MIFESWSIILIIGIMCIVFARAKKFEYCLAILPMAIMPMAYILSMPISLYFYSKFLFPRVYVVVVVLVLSIVIACITLMFSAQKINTPSNRSAFIFMGNAFIIVTGCLYIFNTIDTFQTLI